MDNCFIEKKNEPRFSEHWSSRLLGSWIEPTERSRPFPICLICLKDFQCHLALALEKPNTKQIKRENLIFSIQTINIIIKNSYAFFKLFNHSWIVQLTSVGFKVNFGQIFWQTCDSLIDSNGWKLIKQIKLKSFKVFTSKCIDNSLTKD